MKSKIIKSFFSGSIGFLFYSFFFWLVFFSGYESTDFPIYVDYLSSVPEYKENIFLINSWLYSVGFSDRLSVYLPYYSVGALCIFYICWRIGMVVSIIFVSLIVPFFIFQQFNTIRQSTAGLVLCLALFESAKLTTFIQLVFSFFIHKSSVIVIFFSGLISYNLLKYIKWIFFIFVVFSYFIVDLILFNGLLQYFLDLIGFDSYIYYLNSGFDFANARSEYGAVYVILFLVVLLSPSDSGVRFKIAMMVYLSCFILYSAAPFFVRFTPLLKSAALLYLSFSFKSLIFRFVLVQRYYMILVFVFLCFCVFFLRLAYAA